jgi:Zn-dependent protease with chaperone function
MRWLFVTFMAMAGVAVHGESIDAVLERSQQVRADAHPVVDQASPSVARIRKSFETVLRGAGSVPSVELKVVSGAPLAETLQGRIILVDQSLAEAGEGERMFVLAHELGHVALKHWPQMRNLYQAYIPGEVVQSHTDKVASLLGYDASALAYKQEFEADLFAMRTLRKLGRPPEESVQALMQEGVHGDTATHPGTMKRVRSLRHAAIEDNAGAR